MFLPGGEGVVDKKSIKIRGQYVLITDPDNPEIIKYMEEMKLSKDSQKVIRETKKVIMLIEGLNKTHRSIERITQNKTYDFELIFKSGKEFEVKRPDGLMLKNTITIDMVERTIKRVIKMEGFDSVQDIVFSPAGFNMTMTAKKAVATMEFYRWGGLEYDDYFLHQQVPSRIYW
jgi:hypothetical protein